MNTYAIVGAGGFGREVLPLVREKLGVLSEEKFQIVFVDDGSQAAEINGVAVMTTAEFNALSSGEKFFNIAIGNSRIRERIAAEMISSGALPFTIHSINNSVSLDCNVIGEGAILCPFTTITSNTKIGKYFHANLYSYVAHDCTIGDFVTFAPSVKCNGNVTIEDHAYIGTGAIIKQGTPEKPIVIGEGAVVGMGAVVTKSVAPGTVVVGNPAKPLRKGLGS
ncbi:acetyltransferase [Pseudomonas sp. P7758]|jgi:sugar O-acyltransferase (sialic acid O-acetyltransferase NeuD family)|uniref:acetyltransferase n=1 Tax=unclassified Pseudomonas TaxID=196821 RepID=UPI000272C8DE|nr:MULTISPECIES: acetyltransferase [unclassified Pseudomonas]EJF68658.1 putative acetyl transferase protein [Pseudomonas sp. Ag1]MDQ0665932.1 sugar O-acyltransferase (sialic acid O-acetyltransferase NeuD family) [Pseudomonas sp. W2I6]NWB10258.1 acetyltransferase [Pseudomonas sp. D5002]NWB71890.1 acetyltransferase [Pseudomonas sp. G5001]NWC70499.1 acetyltransferase [Pseudomonas sp. P7758]